MQKGKKKKSGTMKMMEETLIPANVRFSEEEKSRIVLNVLRGENSLEIICETFGLEPRHFFQWSKEFLEAENRKLSVYFDRKEPTKQGEELKTIVEKVKKKLEKL
jgi:transposase